MTKAIAKFIRMSPRKLRRVVNVIRGKDAISARTVLKFMPYSAAKVVEKVLNSAVANAKENNSLNPDELRIAKAYVDQSTTMRRWRAMSRGRGFPILKRTSHVTIEVVHDPNLAHTRGTKHIRKVGHKHDLGHDHEVSHEGHKHETVKKEESEVKVKVKKEKVEKEKKPVLKKEKSEIKDKTKDHVKKKKEGKKEE